MLTVALASDAAYVGAMGSRRALARLPERLAAAGVSEEELGRLVAPIGFDLSAEKTALPIMAELIAVRNRRKDG